MTGSDPKADLHRYLQDAREALLWKLDGLSEYDIRRPLVPTGTNLLGLVKHVASVEFGYFGDCFGRPYEERLPWLEDDAEPNADMWAAPGETREQIKGLYRGARAPTPPQRRPRAAPPRSGPGGAGQPQRGDAAQDPGPHDRRDRPARRAGRHRP